MRGHSIWAAAPKADFEIQLKVLAHSFRRAKNLSAEERVQAGRHTSSVLFYSEGTV